MSHGTHEPVAQAPPHRRVMNQALAVWCCLAFLLAPAVLLEAGQVQKPPPESRVEVVGDVRLPHLTRFALIRNRATRHLSIYREGDAIFEDNNPLPLGKIAAVEDRALRVALTSGGDVQISEGASIRGLRRLVFVRSTWLDTLRFQLRFGGTAAASNKSYSVVEILAHRAILERDAAPGEDPTRATIVAVLGASPRPTGPPATAKSIATPDNSPLREMVNLIPFAEVAPDTWEIPEGNLKEMSDHMWPLLTETLRSAKPVVTSNFGVGLQLDTSLGTGILDQEGFRIDYVKLAQRTGLEVGDRILSVNEQPVNSAGGLVRIYQELRSNAALSDVTLVIKRGGELRTLTYRIR